MFKLQKIWNRCKKVDSTNAEYTVIFIHKLQHKFFSSCFYCSIYMLNHNLKSPLTLVSQLYIGSADPHFKQNGQYAQSSHIYVGENQTRMVNLNLTCTVGTAVALLRCPWGAHPPISQLLWVLTAGSSQLPLTLNVTLYWWELPSTEMSRKLCFPSTSQAVCDQWLTDKHGKKAEPFLKVRQLSGTLPTPGFPVKWAWGQTSPARTSAPSFSLTSSVSLTCYRCHPRPPLEYIICTRIHFSDSACSELDLRQSGILTEGKRINGSWHWNGPFLV